MRLGCGECGCGTDGGGPLDILYPPVPPVMTTNPMAPPPTPYAPTPNPTTSPYPYPYVPKPTTQVMPTMVGTAQVAVSDITPDLVPQDLLRPLPSIVDNQPVVVSECNSFSQWVDGNPLLAAGLLMGLAFVVFRK